MASLLTRFLICPPTTSTTRLNFLFFPVPRSAFFAICFAHFRTRTLAQHSGSLLLSSFLVFYIISVSEYGAT